MLILELKKKRFVFLFTDDDNCAGVDCGPGRMCVDGIDTYTCVY